MEEKYRQEAIRLWLAGVSPRQISRKLRRSRQWVYKWLNRYKAYKAAQSEWYLPESKAPKSTNKKITPRQEELIINIRKRLMEQKYAQIGAISIQYEFYLQRLAPPATWTINRILAKHGLTKAKVPSKGRQPTYPELYLNTQQMDIVGPRYLKGGYRFYVLNIIDVATHFVHIHPVNGKNAEALLQGIIHFWQDFGIPDSLQMDNELSFRGSNRYPRSLGLILRFLLSLNVVPVFIPPAEPWRNGIIEKFNDTFDKKFFRTQEFQDFEHLKREAREFENFHNNTHRYSSQDHKTPVKMHAINGSNVKLDANYHLKERPALEGGVLMFVRFIRSDMKLKILGKVFRVKKALVYSYVVAELIVDIHTLRIKQDNIVHHVFEFIMPVDW